VSFTLSDKEYNSQISSFPARQSSGSLAISRNWKILHTDYRRPYSTYHDAFDAARQSFLLLNHMEF